MNKLLNIFLALFLISLPVVSANEFVANNITNVNHAIPKEYHGLDRALDRIKLSFASQEERKEALINKIEERRKAHYEFLLLKGKIEQANAFQTKTDAFRSRFEAWNIKRYQKLTELEVKATIQRKYLNASSSERNATTKIR